jgi:phosphoribosylanthranilate isomerase
VWIKICGTTNLEDARHAAEAGADALGFIFAPSPRHVTCEQVAAITALLPASIETYGVFVDAPFDEILTTVQAAGLTGVQLHSNLDRNRDPQLPSRLRAHFTAAGKRLGILSVLNFNDDASQDLSPALEAQLSSLAQDDAIDAALVDSRSTTVAGGTGIAFNWHAARPSFLHTAPYLRLIAAGGLRPENVAEAIHTLHPWGVDVVTGVEAAPGKKSPARVTEFIRIAREAFALERRPAYLSSAEAEHGVI